MILAWYLKPGGHQEHSNEFYKRPHTYISAHCVLFWPCQSDDVTWWHLFDKSRIKYFMIYDYFITGGLTAAWSATVRTWRHLVVVVLVLVVGGGGGGDGAGGGDGGGEFSCQRDSVSSKKKKICSFEETFLRWESNSGCVSRCNNNSKHSCLLVQSVADGLWSQAVGDTD